MPEHIGQSGNYKIEITAADNSTKDSSDNYFSIIEPEPVAQSISCAPGQIIGDADGDGQVTEEDAVLVANVTVGLIDMPDDICCIDVTQNGTISGLDSSRISRIANGLESSPGVCEDNDLGLNSLEKQLSSTCCENI